MRFVAALLSTLFASLALAAPPPNSATLTWIPSLVREDGSTITGSLTFNVYQGPSGAESTTPVLTGLTGTSTVITAGLVSGTTVCWVMTEVEVATGLESAKTNEACKTFPASPPTAPAPLTVK